MSNGQTVGVISERWRISHNKTQRDGWGYESSVELVFDGDVTAGLVKRMADSLQTVDTLARNERDARRVMDKMENDRDAALPA